MGEAKHAPGPWTVTHNSWEVSTVYGADGVSVSECHIHASVTEDNAHLLEPIKEANARLIAAAPDYHRQTDLNIGGLEILRRAIEADDPNRELLLRVDDLIRENKAVQAKAEGS